jgi:Domain of unknown function (DUF4424)
MRIMVVGLGLLLPVKVLANDGVAEIGAGGLEFTSNSWVEMQEEDLFISMEQVRVRYVFRNSGEEPQNLLVAFPLPVLQSEWFGVNGDERLAKADPITYLGFETLVDGVPIKTESEQRARVLTIDVTEELRALGIALFPGSPGLGASLAALPEDKLAVLIARGAVERVGSEIVPKWEYQTTFYWRQTYPVDKPVVIEHRYRPIVGGSVPYDQFIQDFGDTYCIGDAFKQTYEANKHGTDAPSFLWLNYILTTARTWAGPIGQFKLTIEQPGPDWAVALCREGMTKTGPTTLQWQAENFRPQTDLDVLFLGR